MEIHSPAAHRHAAVIAAARELERQLRAYLDGGAAEDDAEEIAHEAEAAFAAGNTDEAFALAERALGTANAPLVRARLQHLKGRIRTQQGPALAAHELLVTEAESIAPLDRERASTMLADAAYAAVSAGDPPNARAAAHRARELADNSHTIARADLALGTALLLGEDEAEGSRLIRSALDSALEEINASTAAAETAVVALFWLEDYDAASRLLDILIERGRRAGDPRLSQWLDTSASVYAARGRWSAAEARSREALRVARERGLTLQAASCLTTLAGVAARRGHEAECRRLVAQALAVPERSELVFVWATTALGLLELGLGDLDAVITTLEAIVGASGPRLGGDPSLVYACAYLVEAYTGVGRADDARTTLARLESLARERPRPSIAAVAARSRGLVATAAEFEQHFDRALEHHRRSAVPFARAHTELVYGARLRRARRRADARTHLRAALATFEQLGATTWVARARRELAATRSRSTPTARDVTELLTPQELAVATLVGRGMRNDDVAATLYVTRRAVEYHLTNIYRKLEISSRTQLTAHLARQ